MPLKKDLLLIDVFAIAAGAMISSGLFVLPGIAFEMAGPSIILSYLLAGLLMLPSALSQSELASAMPQSGGGYFFIVRTLGPYAGIFAGIADWVSLGLKSAFALVGLGTLVQMALPNADEWTIKAVAILACAFFTTLNLVSVKGTGRLQFFLVLGLLGILGSYVIFSISEVRTVHFAPFMPNGAASLFAVTGMVFVSYGGLTKVANVSGEIRHPGRNIPLGIFIAFGVVNAFYVLVVFVTVGVLPPGLLAGSLAPLAEGARFTLGSLGFIAIEIAAFLAFVTTANAGILAAARSPMAMARDGLLPERIGRTSNRFHTPHVSILITGIIISLAIAFLSIENLIKSASAVLMLMFVLVNLSVIIMRHSGIHNYRPTFKAPLMPWLQLAAVIAYIFILIEMGHIPLLMSGAIAAVALIWYFVYVRSRIDREYAFILLVQRMISREFFGRGLEDELKQIALERDEVEQDHFDQVVKECIVLDLDQPLDAESLFRKIAETVMARQGLPADTLFRRFMTREEESSTVLKLGLAVPHIIIEGEHLFNMVLVRCVPGIMFPGHEEPVTSAFVLAGSRDERNFHLKALMAIAHIVEEPGFNERWLKARDEEDLRDILLLSKRARVAHSENKAERP